jgi:hypothetical protein
MYGDRPNGPADRFAPTAGTLVVPTAGTLVVESA